MWKLAAVENCIKLQIANAHFHHHAKSFERTKHYNEDIFAWRGECTAYYQLNDPDSLYQALVIRIKIFECQNFKILLVKWYTYVQITK